MDIVLTLLLLNYIFQRQKNIYSSAHLTKYYLLTFDWGDRKVHILISPLQN